MKKLLAFVAAAVTCLSLPVFAADVVLWHAYRAGERKALEKVVESFNSSQKDVRIQLLAVPYDAFADKITAAIPRGRGPDLFIFAQDRLGDWAASELIEPLDFWLDEELEQAFLPPTLEALTYDDAVFGLPIAFKMVALIYNKQLVETPPKTTDELVALGKKLTDAKAEKFGLAYENANFWYHGAWMQGFGGRVFDGKGKPTLDTPSVVQSLAFAQELAHASGIMPQEISSTLVTTLFNRGKVGMVINGPWFLGEIDPSVKYAVAPLPTISKNGEAPRPFLTAEGVIMSARAKDKKAAFEVMKHLTSVEAGLVMAKDGRQTTARREVYEDPAVKKDPVLSVFLSQLAKSVPTPNTPAMRMVWTPATTMMNKVINGKVAPEAAAAPAQAEVSELVAGARR
ncbi:MAG: extracellular solute-binding protein [Myxococcota bacterium]